MARIRSIKPEFPQSESMGRVTRDARLCFIQLWTLADDSGRLRGSSRMLASLLYPYDDDAPGLIGAWLEELVREKCITRYLVDGQNYIEISNWLSHQKIDKPTASKIPPFDESSRILANPREVSSEDWIGLDQGMDQGEEGSGEEPQAASPPEIKKVTSRFDKPSLDEIRAYCHERNNGVSPEKWLAHYEANGWKVGRNTMRDWKAAVRTWEADTPKPKLAPLTPLRKTGFKPGLICPCCSTPLPAGGQVCPHCGAYDRVLPPEVYEGSAA